MKRRLMSIRVATRRGSRSPRQGCFTPKTPTSLEEGNQIATKPLQNRPVDTHDSSLNPCNISSQLHATNTPTSRQDLRAAPTDPPVSSNLLTYPGDRGKSHPTSCRDVRRASTNILDTSTAHRTKQKDSDEKEDEIKPAADPTRPSHRHQREPLSPSGAEKDGIIVNSQPTETPDRRRSRDLPSAEGSNSLHNNKSVPATVPANISHHERLVTTEDPLLLESYAEGFRRQTRRRWSTQRLSPKVLHLRQLQSRSARSIK